MPTKSKTQQIRVDGSDLTRALIAAGAFADADKKSYRHRINLRATEWTITPGDEATPAVTKAALIVGAGSPVRAILVHAGEIPAGEEFNVDLHPKVAATLCKMFGQAGDIALKFDGKVLSVSAVDQLFDNQRSEFRTIPATKNSDVVPIANRMIALTNDTEALLSLPAPSVTSIAAASKALGSSFSSQAVFYGDSNAIRVTFGNRAVAWVTAHPSSTTLDAWELILDTDSDTADIDAWSATEGVNASHILDGALPTPKAAAVVGADGELVVIEETPDAGGINLEELAAQQGDDDEQPTAAANPLEDLSDEPANPDATVLEFKQPAEAVSA